LYGAYVWYRPEGLFGRLYGRIFNWAPVGFCHAMVFWGIKVACPGKNSARGRIQTGDSACWN